MCLGMALLIGFQLFRLQVLQFSKYQAESNKNSIAVIKSFPIRGKIYDRNGKLLATNQVINQLAINSQLNRQQSQAIIAKLAEIIGF